MNDNLKSLADLLKEEKARKASIVAEKSSTDLKAFLQTVAVAKKQHREELQERAVEVLPKLGDFFGAIAKSKEAVKDTIREAEKIIEETPEVVESVIDKSQEREKIIEPVQAVIEIAQELEKVIDFVQDNGSLEIKEDGLEEIQELRHKIKELDSLLKKEVAGLKKQLSASRTIVHQTSGGGEVMFARLDDVSLFNLQDGDVLVWDGNLQKFVNTQLQTTSGGIPGGAQGQVLVKQSSTNNDYAWEDMILNTTQPVYTKLIDDSTSGVMYVGEATPGSMLGSSVWRIQKIIFDINGNVDSVQYANGGDFISSWINRGVLTYS